MSYTYEYPRPMVTVDILLLRLHQEVLQILLIQRRHDPYQWKWALPGGFIEIDEPLQEAARRELLEETGIKNTLLLEIGVYGAPGRDPRGRTITVVFCGILAPHNRQSAHAGDDAGKISWFNIDELPPLAFDHEKIIRECLSKVRFNTLLKFWALLFLPQPEFTMGDFRGIIKHVCDISLSETQCRQMLCRLPFIATNAETGKCSWKESPCALLKADDFYLKFWKDLIP